MALAFSNSLGNALNNKLNPQPLSQSTPIKSGPSVLSQIGSAITANNDRALGVPAGGWQTPATPPQTPVKKTTVSSPSGASVTTEYHAPPVETPAPVAPLATAQQPATPQTQYNAQGQSIGTQLPGMAGFNPQIATNTQTNPGQTMAQADANQPVQTGQTTVYNQNASPVTYQNGTNSSVQPYAPQAPTYQGIVGNLANTALNGSQASQGAVGSLINSAQTNPGASGQAYQNYQNDQAKYAADQLAYNNTYSGLLGQQGIPLEFSTGRAGEFQLQNSGRLQAEQQAVTNDLAGVNANISGTQTQQSGFNEAGGLANTAQSNVQSGLGAAGALAAPALGQYGQSYYNPLTGNSSSGASVQPNDPLYPVLQQYAQLYASGQQSAIPSSITGNPVLNAQVLQMAQQSNPNFNVNTAEGQASAQQSNAATTGTLGTNTAAGGYTQAITTYQNMNTANTAAESQAQQVQQILASTGLNNAASNDYTKAINQLSGRLGSSNVTALNTAVTELQNVYGQLLNSAGNTPSGSEAQALAVLNPNSSAKQITAAIQQLQAAAYNKLSAQYQQAQTYYTATQGGGSTGGIYSF